MLRLAALFNTLNAAIEQELITASTAIRLKDAVLEQSRAVTGLNKERLAALLGVSKRTLYRKLAKVKAAAPQAKAAGAGA